MPVADTLREIDFSQYAADHRAAMLFYIDKPPTRRDDEANTDTYRLRRSRSMEAVREAYNCLRQLTENELYELEHQRLVHLSVPNIGMTEVRHVIERIDERGQVEIDTYAKKQLQRILHGFMNVRNYASRN